MARIGTCECCDKPRMSLPAKGLCGKCYLAHRAGKIFWSAVHRQWLARIEADANRFNCVWMNDPALEPTPAGSEEFAPVGNGEFALAGAAEAADDGRKYPFGSVIGVIDAKAMHGKNGQNETGGESGPADSDPDGPGLGEAAGLDLLEGFEPYQRLAPPPAQPCLLVQKSGKVKFARSAVRAFAMRPGQYVQLFFARAEGRMAMRLLDDNSQGVGLKLTDSRSGDLCFHGGGFFRAMDISPTVGKPYGLTALAPGLLVAFLGEPDAGQDAGQDADRIEDDAA